MRFFLKVSLFLFIKGNKHGPTNYYRRKYSEDENTFTKIQFYITDNNSTTNAI